MAKKAATKPSLILNRRARFDFVLLQNYTAGIVLTGPEVRAVRDHHVSLRGTYVTFKDGELWLINSSFSLAAPGRGQTTVDTSARKLLVNKRQLKALEEAKKQGHTIVPLSMTTTTRFIKLEIAEAQGKKLHDKRQAIKQRDTERETKRLLKR